MWYVDNVASLMSLIQGRASSLELDLMAGMVHSILYGLQAYVYFEWVQSKSDWADGVSRHGHADPWAHRHGFQLFIVDCQPFLWSLLQMILARVFEFL